MSNQITEYNKVSFITSKSSKMPKVLRETGSLIVLSEISIPKRISLWLRNNLIASGWGFSSKENMLNGEWITYSYNKVFSPTEEGMSYFLPSDDIEDVSFFKIRNNQIVGRPQSIHMLISYGMDFTKNYGDNLSTRIDDINRENGQIKEDISYISNIYIPNAIDVTYTYTYDTAKKVLNDAYTYTKYWANRIIGNSPDFLDSLDEIKEFIRNDRENDMRTLSKIGELDKLTVKRKTEEGTYTYIDYDRISYEYVDKNKPRQGTYTYTWYDEDGKSHQSLKEYTYYDTSTYTGGWLALKSEQVSTDDFFGHQQLSVILKRLVQPYPYEVPTLVNFKINNKNIEEWQEEVVEYGTSLNLQSFTITLDKKTASSITGFKCLPVAIGDKTSDSGQINSNVSTDISKTFTTINVPVGEGKSTDINAYHTLFKEYTISYNDAVLMEYPQLIGLEPKIYDREHQYFAGSITNSFNLPIRKKMSYKVYWGTTDGDIPTSNGMMIGSSNNRFLDSQKSTGKLTLDTPKSKIWVSLPSGLTKDIKAVMKSWISGIENDVTTISTEAIGNRLTDEFVHNNIRYKTFFIENTGFTAFAEKVTIEVFFNISEQ